MTSSMAPILLVSTECTPQTSAIRRATASLGLMLRIGVAGRSRAALRLVYPELV